ncbi:N-acetylneuraminate lyase-like [Scylla paramamosain]|uniref:N-acetylneuraminate lyase-like n=1 Tax=Scylla paramamosain TaxID=85552 RepID=UPI003083B93E
MTRLNFKGMMAPTFAPFKADGSLNLEMVKPYAAHLKKQGVTGVWVNGSVGEGLSMTVAERKAVAEAWLACRDDVPTVIVHCGAVCLKDVQEMACHAESHGASAVAVLPNVYERPATTDQLVDYMQEVAKACPRTPLFYYHIPMKTCVNLSMSEFLAKGVKRVPTLAGIKFTDMDVSGEGRKCLAVDSSLTIFSGFDESLQEALSVGFTACVNSSGNFVPQLGSRIFSLMAAGDADGAKKVQDQLLDCLAIIFAESGGFNGAGLKAACTILTGLQLGPTRLPVQMLTQDRMNTVRKNLGSRGFKVY